MKMKRIVLSTLAGCGLAIGVQAATFYYDPNGSGKWSDASRWKGNSGTPGEKDEVRFSTEEVLVDDTDLDVLKNVALVGLDNETAKLIISNDTDHLISTYICGPGEVVKKGSGVLTVNAYDRNKTQKYPFCNSGGWNVQCGDLRIENGNNLTVISIQIPLAVYNPGKIIFAFPMEKNAEGKDITDIHVRSLEGDGTIVNELDPIKKLTFYTSPLGATRTFSGTYSGSFYFISSAASSQCFIGTGCDVLHSAQPILLGGYLGLDKFPDQGIVFRKNTKVEYIGTGREESEAKNCNLNNQAQVVEVSAGPYGDCKIRYKFLNPGDKYTMNEMVFSGNNIKPAIFAGSFSMGKTKEEPKKDLACYIKKTGTGTWRFTSAERANKGTVAIEKGTLEYESIAEKGTSCSLGDASILHSEYTGNRDDDKAVPYAYLIGDGTVAEPDDPTVATMKYVGATPAAILTRPVAVKGSGRFLSKTAKMLWSGFTSASEGNNEIILGGDVEDCRAYGVTNGIGTLSVAKEGLGDWTIDGNSDFSGEVEARAGTLKINASKNYGWYKLTLKENWSGARPGVGDGSIIWIAQFGLFDALGQNWIKGLTHNEEANGDVQKLRPGEAAFNHKDFYYHSSDSTAYSLENAFNGNQSVVCGRRNSVSFATENNPVVNPDAWVEIVVRPNETTNALVRYDIRSWGHSDSDGYKEIFVREARSWSLEGSMDGINWESLDSVISNKTPTTGAVYRWIGTNKDSDHQPGQGLGPIASEPSQDVMRPTSVASVSAMAGAIVKVNAPLATSKIKCDYNGGGTIEGFVFADGNGVIEIVNAPDGLNSISVPVTLLNVGGVENLSKYSVSINGISTVWKGRYANGHLHVNPPGTVVVIR